MTTLPRGAIAVASRLSSSCSLRVEVPALKLTSFPPRNLQREGYRHSHAESRPLVHLVQALSTLLRLQEHISHHTHPHQHIREAGLPVGTN